MYFFPTSLFGEVWVGREVMMNLFVVKFKIVRWFLTCSTLRPVSKLVLKVACLKKLNIKHSSVTYHALSNTPQRSKKTPHQIPSKHLLQPSAYTNPQGCVLSTNPHPRNQPHLYPIRFDAVSNFRLAAKSPIDICPVAQEYPSPHMASYGAGYEGLSQPRAAVPLDVR
jgi:hypothetical protein